MAEPAADPFLSLQPRLLGVAYRMLGNAADAEEIVQDAYVRWLGAERSEIRSPEAFLVAVVTRLALDRLALARNTRETYGGPWLPEPVEPSWPGQAGSRETLSLGFLVLLEKLSPLERAVFVLHEAFDYGHVEIAEILERSEAACRQLLKRARSRIQEERARFQVDERKHRQLLDTFVEACRTGRIEDISALLKRDVVFVSDGGGRVPAARRLLNGRDAVARFVLSQLPRKSGLHVALEMVNGRSAIVARLSDGSVEDLLEVVVEDTGIAAIFALRNPEKLRRLDC